MIDSTTPTILDLLHEAGLNLSITATGMLGVSPSCNLNEDLRNLIRSHKAGLVECVIKSKVATNRVLSSPSKQVRTSSPQTEESSEPSTDPAQWHELADAYNAHHVNCKTCIAAGRGKQYGLRCGTGAALWLLY